MTRLEKLINELCPNGVEYVSIGSLITKESIKGKSRSDISQVYVVSNTLGIIRSEDYHENIIYSQDTSNYTVIENEMFAYNPSRLNIGSIGILKNDISGLVSPMYVVFSVKKSIVLPDYLFIVLKSNFVKNRINTLKEEGARFRFDFERWNKIIIPVPPLEVQEEIVKILNTFKEYSDLLTAELTARKKQYEYYRDKLLSFDVHGGGDS